MIKDVPTVILKKEIPKNVENRILGGVLKFLFENPRGQNLKNRQNGLKKILSKIDHPYYKGTKQGLKMPYSDLTPLLPFWRFLQIGN